MIKTQISRECRRDRIWQKSKSNKQKALTKACGQRKMAKILFHIWQMLDGKERKRSNLESQQSSKKSKANVKRKQRQQHKHTTGLSDKGRERRSNCSASAFSGYCFGVVTSTHTHTLTDTHTHINSQTQNGRCRPAGATIPLGETVLKRSVWSSALLTSQA